MKQIENTLYGKDKSGNLKVWEVFVNDNNVIVKFGRLGGKIQEKSTPAFGKNKGKANETSDIEQAIAEAKAKYVKQLKSEYFLTKEEALGSESIKPTKAHDYRFHKDKIVLPCYVQPKLNGLRCLKHQQEALSKSGEVYKLPNKEWKGMFEFLGDIPLDGEVYAGLSDKKGVLSLQQINSAWKKPNDNTKYLKYYVYDSPHKDMPWHERLDYLQTLQQLLESFPKVEQEIPIVFVEGRWVHTEAEADKYYQECIDAGYEGIVYRSLEGEYEYGTRSYSIIKRKPRPDAEALVLSSLKDKNNEGVLTCKLESGIIFDLKMRVDSDENINYRKYENSLQLINKYIKFEYEDLSDDGKPQKAVGVGLRDVNPVTWEPID